MKRIPTKRRPSLRAAVLGSALMISALAACSSSDADEASSPDECSFDVAVADDDVRRAAFYAIENDLIGADSLPNLTISYLAFPALIQSVGKTQYDLVESSLTGVAVAREQGLELDILALSGSYTGGGGLAWYVAEDSDIDSPEDLEGKTIGVTSLGSTATTTTRIVLSEKYGFDTQDVTGGDVKFVELPATQLMSSLERGQIDVADMYAYLAYQASQNPSVRELSQTDTDFIELTGSDFIGAAYQMLHSQYEAKPDCYLEFQELLDESVQYARDNIDDFSGEIAEETGLDEEFVVSQWQGESYDYVANVDPGWIEAAQNMWDQEEEFGTIPPAAPDIESVIVE